jgi:hypothetical protein
MDRPSLLFVMAVILSIAVPPNSARAQTLNHADIDRAVAALSKEAAMPERTPGISPLMSGRTQPPAGTTQVGSHLNRGTRQVVGGIVGAIGGFFVGGIIGAQLEGNCGCDDPGLSGAIVVGGVGAVAGAVVGVLLASR